MVKVDLSAARVLIRAICDSASSQAVAEAMAMRDKWLMEADFDLLHMSPEVRAMLAQAAPQDGIGS